MNGHGSISSKKSFQSFRQMQQKLDNPQSDEDEDLPSLNVESIDLNKISNHYGSEYDNMMNDKSFHDDLRNRKGSASSNISEEATELIVSPKSMSRSTALKTLQKSLPKITTSKTQQQQLPIYEEEEEKVKRYPQQLKEPYSSEEEDDDDDETSEDLIEDDIFHHENIHVETIAINPGISISPNSTINQDQTQQQQQKQQQQHHHQQQTPQSPPLQSQVTQVTPPLQQHLQQQHILSPGTINIKGHILDKSIPINLNVGGTLFATSLRTICNYPPGLLFKIVEMQIQMILNDEVIFIDRNPIYFSQILDYLRTGRYLAPIKSTSAVLNTKALIQEAEFFKIQPMVEQIKNEPELSRVEIIKIINSCYDYPRFRGLYLCKTNFHGLDLNCATFEYSNLSECTFHSTLLTNVNFYNAKLDKVLFRNSKASNSTFSNSEITNSQFTNNICLEIASVNSNYSNSKLTGSVFSCSNFVGSNFRGAQLQGCDFTNCNLSNCDFTGAILDSQTNFSGSNLKNTCFDNCDFSIAKSLAKWKKPKTIRNRNKITIPHI